jgi:hypothetical protein
MFTVDPAKVDGRRGRPVAQLPVLVFIGSLRPIAGGICFWSWSPVPLSRGHCPGMFHLLNRFLHWTA